SIAANAQRDVDVLFRAAARLAGAPQGDLALVLDLVEQGRATELARAVEPHTDAADLLPSLAARVGAAIALAARTPNIGRWRHSWSGGGVFTGADGTTLALREVSRWGVDPAPVAEARQRLGTLGISVSAVRQQSAGATAEGADVLGGIANMKSGNQYLDVFIL